MIVIKSAAFKKDCLFNRQSFIIALAGSALFSYYVSLITSCKPCSVPSYCNRSKSRTPAAIIYLQTHAVCPFPRSFPWERRPYQIWVSRSRGLPRSTLFCFQKGSVTVALL